ncbi:uncharacterized protein E0L32_000577 [Thyridium curvatum]|uniref:DH domain-containing protein n=1 Tax=Thyridium curvatum TaxID=1093900 RepID=A0A507B2U4_9PEZI|nr:uncharacterized protein E0L32_000577 [Thyridium curvatum]TPX14183.1 hypothetical protein E0L32_000577 [Thyridium curvatum]
MDGGNRDEEDRLGPASIPFSDLQPPHLHSIHQHQQQHHHHHHNLRQQADPVHHQYHHDYSLRQHQEQPHRREHPEAHSPYHHYQQHHRQYSDEAALPSPSLYDSRPGQIPVASYAASNFDAVAANAALGVDAFADPTDPDDFYRDYRGASPTQPAGLVFSPDDLMASGPTAGRQNSSLRSNSNGTTPRHPPVPPGRQGLRSGVRSASSPVDDKALTGTARTGAPLTNGYSGLAKTNVKDLKKRFDATTPQPSSAIPQRKIISRSSPRDASSSSIPTRSSGYGTSQTSYQALRSGAAADTTRPAASRGTQRQKFAAEDQLSSNAQSFASRINRPRTSISSNSQASKSMTHLSPKSSPKPTIASPTSTHSNGLLFGEILPDQNDTYTAGFGIEGSRQRRTSESNLRDSIRPRQRSRSDAQPEPNSPTDWYRGVASSRPQAEQHSAYKGSATHNRSQSDVVGSKITTAHPIHISQQLAVEQRSDSQAISPTSRLPVSVRKLSTISNPSSEASTRSSSPSTKRPPTSVKTSRHQPPPVSRAKTPVRRAATPTTTTTRSKTPTSGRPPSSTKKQPPSQIATSSGNNRLNAYITAPPPKLSPTLRSSRPRQPVSTASTASSRMRAVDRAKSPAPARARAKRDESATRRKIDVGPIDFAQRRETIRLAYSRSIRERDAKEARQAAAERRRKDMERVAKAKADAEAAALAQEKAERANEEAEKSRQLEKPDKGIISGTESPISTREADDESPILGRLKLATSPLEETVKGSPTLGIPGSFPSYNSPKSDQEEIPQSAISTTSAITEFDNETQTEPPVQEPLEAPQPEPSVPKPQPILTHHERATYRSPFEVATPDTESPRSAEIGVAFSPGLPSHDKVEYRSPFEETGMQDDSASIQISLDTMPSPHQKSVDEHEASVDNVEFDNVPVALELSGDDYHQGQYVEEPDQAYEEEEVERQSESDYPTITPSANLGELLRGEFAPGGGPEPMLETADIEPDFEAQPYSPDSHHTTVTIVSRDSDFGVGGSDAGDDSSVAKRAHLENFEGFYGGTSLRDNVAVLRDSAFAPSEFSDEPVPSSGEYQRTPETSHSLTVPALASPANRSSQQSGWTDFSVDSSDGQDCSARESTGRNSGSVVVTRRPVRPPGSRPESGSEEPGYQEPQYSPELSPLDESQPRVSYASQHQLPELDTGDGFSIPYLSDNAATQSAPMLPDHSPPPIPTSAQRSLHETARSSSMGYYEQMRSSTYSHSIPGEQGSSGFAPSRPESHDFTPDFSQAASTPLSAERPSLEPSLRSIGGDTLFEQDRKMQDEATASRESISNEKQAPPSKEKSRLTQRQMVIRELVDTEAVFVRDMNIVEEIYKGTADACTKLDTQTVKLIFRNTDEIITFHTSFLAQLKDGVSSVYSPKGGRSPPPVDSREDSVISDSMTINSNAASGALDDIKDRQTSLGPLFMANIEAMRAAHEGFLRTSDQAAKKLIQIQEDPTVKVWLTECNEVAKDLTAAWNLDSLLIKPMQRITKYPNLITQLLQHTPSDHPDRDSLMQARTALENAILEINKTKKNFELVGQIVGRKRKESDVRAGFARAFGKRVDKLQASGSRPAEDPEYLKLHEKFGDDYLRLQVVLRDVEFYTRQVSAYVHEFLQYLSAMELVMRLQPSPWPELESKWARFNVSMRDIQKVALEQHLSQVRKQVIEPFEQVIKCYSNPSLAMKKRAKRRLDYEKAVQLKKGGKKVDKQLTEFVEQYEALNETLKKELPKLSANTEKIGNICLANFVNIQTNWFSIWKEKVKVVLDSQHVPELSEITTTFHREFKELEEQINSLGILNPTLKPRTSQSTTDGDVGRSRPRPSDLSPRGRGLSQNSDLAPTLPTPDFGRRTSGQFVITTGNIMGGPPSGTMPSSPHHYYYRDYYAGINTSSSNAGQSGQPLTPELGSASSRSVAGGSARPSTGRSYDSSVLPRQSTESGPAPPTQPPPAPPSGMQSRRDSGSTYNSNYPPNSSATAGQESRRFSGLFHSALPLPDDAEDSRKSSRASSRERGGDRNAGYNVMWLAASLFEFNIETTKHEAGYPYLTYQAGEIFDVIAEKGELWLAKNQDDPHDQVGWIWSKHFAKLADS